MNDPRFVTRMQGTGAYAEEMRALFDLGIRRAGLRKSPPPLAVDRFRVPGGQGSLFT
jgi:hypothetical protein